MIKVRVNSCGGIHTIKTPSQSRLGWSYSTSKFWGFCCSFQSVSCSRLVFTFCVSSAEVGFEIVRGGNISNDLLSMDFLLWGAGDPDLRSSYFNYQRSINREWTVVSNNNQKKSYAQAAKEPRFFVFSSKARSGSSALQRLQDHQGSIIPVLTAPNNVALGGAGSLQIQNLDAQPATRHNNSAQQFCIRCLGFGHLRPNCTNRIRCRTCKRLGHVAASCFFSNKRVNDTPSILGNRNESFSAVNRHQRDLTGHSKTAEP